MHQSTPLRRPANVELDRHLLSLGYGLGGHPEPDLPCPVCGYDRRWGYEPMRLRSCSHCGAVHGRAGDA